ncbi:MAG: oligoribonuclease [Gammaproteobacteria bacterium]|nr:oligoribonuclease [Gammaproteobacteria bacterium]
MSISETNLIWIDLEMTGLDTQYDHIIEIATIVTDKHLNILAEGPVLALYQPEGVLNAMDSWNQKQHRESGLLARVQDSELTAADAERETLAFLKRYVPEGKSPICGNSICQDRRFLHREMPNLDKYFHYRNLDVSTLKILAQLWAPEVYSGVKKHSAHRALDDIKDSIAELRHYRDSFLKI